MNKKILILAVILIAAIAGVILLNSQKQPNSQNQGQNNEKPASNLKPQNAEYFIETSMVKLENGKAETINPDGAQKMTTEITGDPVSGDLNSDGQNDWAVVIKQQTQNDPAIYYYVAVALVDENKNMIVGSNAVPLGEGVKIQDIAIVNQAVRVNFLERKLDGDNVEKEPTVPVSKSYILDGILRELTPKRANAQAEAACTDNRGDWNKDKSECSGISKELCDQFGGNFENDLCKF
jgi:type II secretory pathway pseudopilin PulG